jgi:hypothetical protein
MAAEVEVEVAEVAMEAEAETVGDGKQVVMAVNRRQQQ